jgi:hypothetical protein
MEEELQMTKISDSSLASLRDSSTKIPSMSASHILIVEFIRLLSLELKMTTLNTSILFPWYLLLKPLDSMRMLKSPQIRKTQD